MPRVLGSTEASTHDHAAGGVEAGVQEHGAEQGFDRVGQDRWPAKTAALQFAFAQAQVLGQLQALGDVRQRSLLDQVGAQARQIALVDLRVTLEQHRRDDEVEHGIPEELQALVVARPMAAVGQRLFKQCWVTEVVIQPVF